MRFWAALLLTGWAATAWAGAPAAVRLSPAPLRAGNGVHVDMRDTLRAAGLREPAQELALRPGPSVAYPQDAFFSKNERFENVDVVLDSKAGVEQAAQAIVDGGGKATALRQLSEAFGAGKREVPLADLLPEPVGAAVNSRGDCHGPNCHNAALAFGDPSIGLKHTGAETLSGKLERDYRRLQPGEAPRFGDLIAFWDPTRSHGYVHSAIYLNMATVFHKASQFAGDPYTFESWAQMARYYGRWQALETRVFRKAKR